ncbi:MAG: copper resistance protein B [Parasphingopyxis sp.]|uniref:copper resistance protein B n=1 Tax=Parasphingopyxis sp. TaxID=1920299 RepID=UPI003F9FF882
MKRTIALAALIAASPAVAQHQGHGTGQPADPHADHAMDAQAEQSPAQAPDIHVGHDMTQGSETVSDDGHATPQAAEPDPHAGHRMDGSAERHDGHATPADDPHAGHAMPGMAGDTPLPQSGPPPEALSGPAHAADTVFPPAVMAEARENLRRETGAMTVGLFSVDRLEAAIGSGEDAYAWELNARYGGDIDRLWIKSEGEGAFGGSLEEVEIQALWSHAIGPFFDFQAGVRADFRDGPDSTHLALGVQGLAPYMFEVDIAGFLSDDGDLTARIEAEYDQRLSQSLILQPRVELNFAAQDVPELGIGSGFSDLEAGLRLRYEFSPQFAPYIGIEWQRQFGDTADFARAAGEDPDRIVFLAGVRFWF